MRLLLLTIGIFGGTFLFAASAAAQNYPWCAVYGSPFGGGGGTNCGFTTFQQCLATISGIGGSCEPNTQYVPPPGPRAPVNRRRHKHPS